MKKILTIITITILAFQVNAQTANKSNRKGNSFGYWSADVGYLLSGNATNNKENKSLFTGNGYSVGLGYRYGDRWGIGAKAAYTGGSTNENNVNDFARTLVQEPFVYKISGSINNWSQFNFAAGPSVFLDKNYKFEVSAVGGISTGSARNIKIDRYDTDVYLNTVYEANEKSVKPFWEVGASYSFAKIAKRTVMGIKGSYGSNGGTIGVIFSINEQDCWNSPCFRCQGRGCTGDMPKIDEL